MSLRDIEELLAERGIDVSYETIRRWVAVFGPAIARRLRAMRPKPHTTWHLDEMFVSIGGKKMYLWRAVDAEGEVLDCLVQSRRNKRAALLDAQTHSQVSHGPCDIRHRQTAFLRGGKSRTAGDDCT